MYHFQVSIPMVFLFANDGKTLLKAMAAAESRLAVTISDSLPSSSKLYYRMGTGFVFNITLGVVHAVFITKRVLWYGGVCVCVLGTPVAAPPSNTDDTEDSSFDITSPVSFFLEKSRQQMENYLRGVLSPSTSINQGASMILKHFWWFWWTIGKRPILATSTQNIQKILRPHNFKNLLGWN